jgi:hypothetical protein
MTYSQTLSSTQYVDERIASRCICCGSDGLDRSPAILMPFVAKRVFGWEPVEIKADWGLRDIKPGMAYPLCNSVRCAVCGVVFLDIRFSKSEMAALYTGYRDERYAELRESFEPGYKIRNAALAVGINYLPEVEKFLSLYVAPPMTILDWGGDTGINTPFKSDRNIVHIYDISNKPATESAISVPIDVVEMTDYDLIVFSNVLEHVPFPVHTISEICSTMKDHTVLYIEVPHEDLIRLNSDEKNIQIIKKHWHEHINFFTHCSLELLLERCGLMILGMQSMQISVAGKVGYTYLIACKLK